MVEFTPITSQEEFDSRLADRLERERKSVKKQTEELYASYVKPEDFEQSKKGYEETISGLNTQIEELKTTHASALAERDNKIKGYETASVKTRIARESGLSFEAIDFLKGEDEDSIRKSAESLRSLMQISQPKTPAKSTEDDGNTSAYQELLNGLKVD